MSIRRWTQRSCAACAFWLVMAGGAGLVLLLVVSRLALDAAVSATQGFFSFFWAAVTALIQGLATLSAAAAWSLGLTALVLAGWLWIRHRREHQWRRLETVRDEYEPLLALLKRKGMTTYRKRLEAMRERLFLERDRAEELEELLEGELPRIEERFRELSNQYHRPGPEAAKREIWSLMESLTANSSALRGRRASVDRFEAGKIQIATKLNCLRLKLSGIEQDESELGSLLRTIDDISFVADAVDRPRDAASEPLVPPPVHRPLTPARPEEPAEPTESREPPRRPEQPPSA